MSGNVTAHRSRVPKGTLTFLFSDIEGSTRRWENAREQMPRAVERHDAIVRSAIERHRGYIFKTGGDAFCCVFTDAVDALGAALSAQLALAAEDFSAVDGLRVRMGLHAGHAHVRGGDYFGPAVNRVSRVMSIAHGGQVLLSNAVYELIKGEPLTDTTFTDMGLHLLKDLAQPEQVWQATSAGMLSAFPQLRSVSSYPNNLPLQVNAFFGRERDIEEIQQHVRERRLLTIMGAGGVGKTRLAIQVGADLVDQFADGVWFADLAPLRDPSLVVSVVGQALGVAQSAGALDHDAIVRWLRPKQLLLILDDAEHLLDAIARLADAIARHCPAARMLVTSRQALGIDGEKVVRLPSLDVPHARHEHSPDAAVRFGAVALFVDRANLVNSSFTLDEHNAPLVIEICRRLDGIPLAIELAAARVKTMSIAGLAQRLDERFQILTGGSRTAVPRQQTLSALIDWSYELLEPKERTLFCRVATFAADFSLQAAVSVCAGDGIDQSDVFELLCSLADKSLLQIDTSDPEERYRLLESTRQYGLAKLTAAGENERVRRANAEYFLKLGLELESVASSMELGPWLARVERDLENFRATLQWALAEQHDGALGGALASALETFWWHSGVEAEGRFWVAKAISLLDAAAYPDVAQRLAQTQERLTSRMLFS